MTSREDKLNAALDALRAEYIADGPKRIAELWSEFARVQNGDAAALPRLRTLVHKLAGSGGAYGLPDVTARARAVEQMCYALIEPQVPAAADQLAQLRGLIQRVADGFHEASSLE